MAEVSNVTKKNDIGGWKSLSPEERAARITKMQTARAAAWEAMSPEEKADVIRRRKIGQAKHYAKRRAAKAKAAEQGTGKTVNAAAPAFIDKAVRVRRKPSFWRRVRDLLHWFA